MRTRPSDRTVPLVIRAGATLSLAVVVVACGSPGPSATATPSSRASASAGAAAAASAAASAGSSASASPGDGQPVEFTPMKLTGHGSQTVPIDLPAAAGAIAAITGGGTSRFQVTSLAADGSANDLLVNTTAPYHGTVLFDAEVSHHTTSFKVASDSDWTITVSPISAARPWDAKGTLKGTSDDVVLLDAPLAGPTSATIANTGQGLFVVTTYSAFGTMGTIVNRSGPDKAKATMDGGTQLVVISAGGAWTITIG